MTWGWAWDLGLIEALDMNQRVDLLALMMQHMTRVINPYKRAHGLEYGYFLSKLFAAFKFHVVMERCALNMKWLIRRCLTNAVLVNLGPKEKVPWLTFSWSCRLPRHELYQLRQKFMAFIKICRLLSLRISSSVFRCMRRPLLAMLAWNSWWSWLIPFPSVAPSS